MPPTPTRSTPAWARRWWWRCSATTRLLLGHVGDSRAYRLRAGRLQQITRDHSLLQEQIDAGLITAEQAAFSANKNLVTRAVGVEDTVLLETHLHEVQPGDMYLMCSDGLSDMLDDAAHRQLLQTPRVARRGGPALIDAANDAGGKDNISVILVRAAGGPGRAGAFLVAVPALSGAPRSSGRCSNGAQPRLEDEHGQAGGVARRCGHQGSPDHKDKTTLGRRPYNDIVIDNLAVSGEHAVLQMVGADVFIEDLNSTNGTYINGKAIKKQLLAHNDTVEIGKYKIKYLVDDGGDYEKTMIMRQAAARRGRRRGAPPSRSRRPRRLGANSGFGTLGASSNPASIKVLNGAAAGREVTLTKVVTTVGKPGVQVASITKRPGGYVFAHVEGAHAPERQRHAADRRLGARCATAT